LTDAPTPEQPPLGVAQDDADIGPESIPVDHGRTSLVSSAFFHTLQHGGKSTRRLVVADMLDF
jgi:hypothetical protein